MPHTNIDPAGDLHGEQSRAADAAKVGIAGRAAPATRTLGVSPKLIAAVILAVATEIVTNPVLELPDWARVAAQLVVVGLGVFAAAPGEVTSAPVDRRNPEAGYGLVELAVAVLILAVAVLIILRVA